MPFVSANPAAPIVPASMSTSTRRSPWLGYVAAACLATTCMGAAAKHATGVCPARPAAITQIDIFDGDPADQAFLAPDDAEAGANTYTVKAIYDAGRMVTVRCHYGESTTDIRLTAPVSRCKLSGDDRHPVLACR